MSTKIAIVGLGCRMPGAASPAMYWRNIVAGVESIRDFSDAELLEAGVLPEDACAPGYVKRAPLLDDVAGFDAGLFGFTPTDAAIADPQQRILLEVCRDALDDGGLTLTAKRLVTGVFASSGGSVSSYLVSVVRALSDTRTLSTGGAIHLGNDKDFASTRVSYKLDLHGPSLNVQTACSSSIVAVHLACQSLLSGECDIALAGASCVRVPQVAGYHPGADPVLSRDGRCRPFDAQASGTLFGSGAAAVVLRRYEDAKQDRDHIYAVILATGVNNDGGQKVSYTASSVPGQKACIENVLRKADVSPEEIGYVECHGTATKIGDPLEIKSLTQAFRATTDRKNFCGIGSVKGNIGHLEQAAGMASLIKTVLMLKHKTFVPSIHCDTVNPKINIGDSPFYVTREARHWEASDSAPRTAGLSCLGMGGTNAFAVLREHTTKADERPDARDAGRGTLFCLSAKTADALTAYAERYATFLRAGTPQASLAEIAYTTNISRTDFDHRLAMVVRSTDELATELARFASETAPRAGSRRLPIAYWCEADAWYPAEELTAAALGSAPDEVREHHRLAADRIRGALTPYAARCSQVGVVVLKQLTAVFSYEFLLRELLSYFGAHVEAYHGLGVGGELAQCLTDPSLLEPRLHNAARFIVDWAGSGRTDGPGATDPIQTYGAFAQEFLRQLESGTEACGTGKRPSALDHSGHFLLQAHDSGSSRATALAKHIGVAKDSLAHLLAALYAAGTQPRWDRYYQGTKLTKVSLPTYPYQRKPYWFTEVLKETKNGRRISDADRNHP